MRLNVQIAFVMAVATTLPVDSQTPVVPAAPVAPAVAAAEILVETVGSMPVQTVLPGRLMSGPGWRVRETAPTDGYAGWYTLECEYGTFGCMGIEMLEERVRELYAIRELDRVSKTGVFLKAAGEAAAKPFEAAAHIVKDPVGSIKKAPAGIAGLFKRVGKGAQELGRTAQKQAQAREDRYQQTGSYSASPEEMAASRSRQQWAAKLGVDPYTTNPVLAGKLNEFAVLSFTGSTLTSFGISAVAMPLTVTQKVDEYVLTMPPAKVKEINAGKLQRLGVSSASATALLDNGFFTPTLETRFVKGLAGLGGVAGLDRVVALASGAASEVQARFFCRTVEMLSSYHRAKGTLTSLTVHAPLPVATTRDGSVVVAAAVDYLPWTARTAKFAGTAPVAPNRVLLSTGPLTVAADRAFKQSGWTVIYAGKL
jgi:hypothetical protein